MRIRPIFTVLSLMAALGPAHANNDTILNASQVQHYPEQLVGLMLNRQPQVADNLYDVEHYAKHIWCHRLENQTDPEARRQTLLSIQKTIKDTATNSPSKVTPIWRPFTFGRYDRTKGTISIQIGQQEWQQSARVGHLIGLSNRKCWPQGPFPQEVYALPDWSMIPTEFPVTEAEAQKLLQPSPFGPPQWNQNALPMAIDFHGQTVAQLTFTMDVVSFTTEPAQHPHVVLRGPTLRWTMRLANSFNDTVREFTSETWKAAAPKAPASSPDTMSSISVGQRMVTDTANVRQSPSLDAAKAGVLQPGQTVIVTGSSDDGQWSSVTFPDGMGWVFNRVLLKSSSAL